MEQGGPLYHGIPLEELEINTVLWLDEAAEHIRHRTERKGRYDPGVEPEWATEAATDEFTMRAVSPSSPSLVVFGYSPSVPASTGGMGRVLKVFLRPIDLSTGDWLGMSACAASGSAERKYWKLRRGET